MSIDSQNTQEFHGLSRYFWPVHKQEFKRVLFLSLMMACVLFNYTILRDLKDILILTARGCGAEAISFLKMWGTLPAAIVLMGVYAKLSISVSKNTLFYLSLSFFFVFFISFNYLIYPNIDTLHASTEWISNWCDKLPRLRYIVPLIGNWSFSMFYIMSEIWGSVGLSVLFWQLANETTPSSSAKRLYTVFGLLSNFGVLTSGISLIVIERFTRHLAESERWPANLSIVTIEMSICFIVIAATHFYFRKSISKEKQSVEDTQGKPKKKKVKMGFFESMKFVFSSKYLGLIAILVLSYGITVNFVEVTFKSQLKLLFPNKSDMMSFLGGFSGCTGIATIIIMVISTNLTRIYSWFTCAIIVPAVMLFAGSAFFVFIIFKTFFTKFFGIPSSLVLQVTVFFGAIAVILVKASKYAIFDPTKERAYIPLEDNLKTRGKAAVDGIGGRLGKSGGGIIQQALFILSSGGMATQLSIAPKIAIIMVILVVCWMFAVKSLSVKFNQASKTS